MSDSTGFPGTRERRYYFSASTKDVTTLTQWTKIGPVPERNRDCRLSLRYHTSTNQTGSIQNTFNLGVPTSTRNTDPHQPPSVNPVPLSTEYLRDHGKSSLPPSRVRFEGSLDQQLYSDRGG